MIDHEKMRALAAETRHMADVAVELGWNGCAEQFTECADAIEALLAEVEAAAADKRDAALWRKWAPWMKNLRRKPFDLAVALDRISLAQRQEGS